MTNVEMLQKKIRYVKARPTELAVAMGVSMPTYYSRISGKSEFTAPEIVAMTHALHLTKEERDAIFLLGDVN